MAASHKELSTAEIAYAAIEEVLSLFSIKSLYFWGEEILKHATNHPFMVFSILFYDDNNNFEIHCKIVKFYFYNDT